MRKTIYLRDDVDVDVINYINKLEKNKENISAFFVNAAKCYLEENKSTSRELKKLVREIISEEYKNVPRAVSEPENDTGNELANKLKSISVYDD